jgi:hypothetical protein
MPYVGKRMPTAGIRSQGVRNGKADEPLRRPNADNGAPQQGRVAAIAALK